MSTAAGGRRKRTDDSWVHAIDPRMPEVAHGWKLHVSARPGSLEKVVGLVLPALEEFVCHVKYARTPEILRSLNSGIRSPGAVGKAVTVYPAPGTVVEIAEALVGILDGFDGPRVASDLRVSPSAPVYYRYGPFQATYRTTAGGRLESVMTGPGGQTFDGLATGRYRCPPWAPDPFRPAEAALSASSSSSSASASSASSSAFSASLSGGRYQITSGIVRTPHGNVYRAHDHGSDTRVVLKQARAFVAEDDAGRDARSRLRHERRVLERLAGIDGIPEYVDYFKHGADEFLVMTDCGSADLRRDVLERGPYRPGAGNRDPLALADRLTGILDRVHRRGVVVRDVKPGNVVLDEAGLCHIVDFGISAVDGEGPDGVTLGYGAPDRAGDAADAEPGDDLYALGVTLGFAVTGLEPVLIDEDAVVNRDRTLAGLQAAEAPAGVTARIRTLMNVSDDSRMPPIPDDDLLDEIIAHTLEYCLEAARETVRDGSAAIDFYAGSSGLGWELLQHRERPEVAEAVDQLAHWTARQERELSASLYSGRSGVAVFLQQAGLPYSHEELLPRDRLDGRPPEADLIEGAAGIGLGHLLLAEGSADPLIQLAGAAECQRVLVNGAATLTPTHAAKPGNAALAEGIAHGDAGVAYFLAAYARAVGDRPGGSEVVAAAREACDRLAALTPAVIARALAPEATRRYGSWCRGLAGIGSVLIQADHYSGVPRYRELAEQCADVCVGIAPRLPHVVQCCGLAGVGDFLIDVATATASGRRWDEASAVARLILARSGGTWSRPVLPDVDLTRVSAGWAGGTSGVLGFLRRLRRRGGPRLATVYGTGTAQGPGH